MQLSEGGMGTATRYIGHILVFLIAVATVFALVLIHRQSYCLPPVGFEFGFQRKKRSPFGFLGNQKNFCRGLHKICRGLK